MLILEKMLMPVQLLRVLEISHHVEGVCAFANHYKDNERAVEIEYPRDSRSGQSSPGYLHVGQVPSNCTRQMPHTSSSGMSHLHVATACHVLILTFMLQSEYVVRVFALNVEKGPVDFIAAVGEA